MAKIFTKGAYRKQKGEKHRTAKKLRKKQLKKSLMKFRDLHVDDK